MTWADSSFIVSLYVDTDQSGIARTYLAANPQPMALTLFSKAEASHALRLCAFRGEISEERMVQYLHSFEQDQTEGFYESIVMDTESFYLKAAQLSHRYAQLQGTRFLDLLHVAGALQIKARRFLTFDQRQGKLAKSAGLEVRP